MKTVFELSLRRLLTHRILLITMIVFPVLITFVANMDGLESVAYAYSLFGIILLFTSFMMAKQLIEDRQSKTIIRIAASPINHKDYLLGHLGAYLLIMSLQVTLFFLLMLLRTSMDLPFYIWAYILMIVFSIMSICFSLFWFSLFKRFTTAVAVYSVVANLMAIIGGMSFPLALMPDNIRQIAIVFPTYWYAFGLEEASHGTSSTIIISLLILLGFAIIFLTIGSKRRFE